jgi:hypothetical protein
MVGIVLDAVLSSRALKAWMRVEQGEVALSLSRYLMEWDERDGRLYSTGGLIASVDLVRRGRDPNAVIHAVTPPDRMTEAQLETQRRWDAYLADSSNPLGIDLLQDAGRSGHRAFAPLGPVVHPLRLEWLRPGRAELAA